MCRTTFAAAAGCFVALVLVPSAAYSQEQPATFATYYECDQTKEARADTIVTEIFTPVLERFISEGKLQSSAWFAHLVGGKWRRLAVVTATDRSAVLKAWTEFTAELQQRHAIETQEFISICHTHEDYIWDTIITRS